MWYHVGVFLKGHFAIERKAAQIDMTAHTQIRKRKAVEAVAHKAKAGRSAYVMKRGQDVYSYLRIEERNGDRLHDGTHIIYVNGAAKGDSAVCKLIHDLLCRDAAEMYFDLLGKRVGEFKNSEEGRHAMCKAMERIEARGKRETMLATAKRMLKDGILALKDVARYSGLSLAQVKKLQAAMA